MSIRWRSPGAGAACRRPGPRRSCRPQPETARMADPPIPDGPILAGHAAWAALAVPPPGLAFAREEGRLDPAEFTAVVRASGLGRPIDDAARMAAMLAG